LGCKPAHCHNFAIGDVLTGSQTLIARAALAVVAGTVSLAATNSRFAALPRKTFDHLVLAAFILSRLGLYLTVFFILHLLPRGDITAFYWSEANAVLRHLVPYSGFQSSYAPLHPFLDAAVIRLWHNPLALILLAICIEAFVLPLWFRVGRLVVPEPEVRIGSLLYLTSVISLQFVTIDGQDNVFIAVLLVFALFLIRHRLNFASGVAAGIGPVAVKFLPLVFAPAFFFAVPRRWRWIAGFTAVIALVYGICIVRHLPILQPLALEGEFKSAGNIPYVFESLAGVIFPPRLWDGLLLIVLGIIFALVANASRRASLMGRLRILTFACPSIVLALLLFSKKSWPPYLMLALFPLCLLIAAGRRSRIVVFALFSLVAVVEQSYWASIMLQIYAPEFHRALLVLEPRSIILLALQFLLLAGYLWLLVLSLRQISPGPLPAGDELIGAGGA
jgi:hypothetical protein